MLCKCPSARQDVGFCEKSITTSCIYFDPHINFKLVKGFIGKTFIFVYFYHVYFLRRLAFGFFPALLRRPLFFPPPRRLPATHPTHIAAAVPIPYPPKSDEEKIRNPSSHISPNDISASIPPYNSVPSLPLTAMHVPTVAAMPHAAYTQIAADVSGRIPCTNSSEHSAFTARLTANIAVNPIQVFFPNSFRNPDIKKPPPNALIKHIQGRISYSGIIPFLRRELLLQRSLQRPLPSLQPSWHRAAVRQPAHPGYPQSR